MLLSTANSLKLLNHYTTQLSQQKETTKSNYSKCKDARG